MTRQDYMQGRVTHHEYYSALAKACGISFERSSMLPRIKAALASGDEHLNSIPLKTWDAMAVSGWHNVGRNRLKDFNETNTLAVNVCMLKAAARDAAEKEGK